MDEKATDDLMRRMRRLEREAVRLRRGVVTDTSPLSVALGGSDVSLADVRPLAGVSPSVDDHVAVLASGNDLLVIGVLA